jgi:hypothetical protein
LAKAKAVLEVVGKAHALLDLDRSYVGLGGGMCS